MHEYRISAVVSLKMNFQRKRERERERKIVAKQISAEKGEITFLRLNLDAAAAHSLRRMNLKNGLANTSNQIARSRVRIPVPARFFSCKIVVKDKDCSMFTCVCYYVVVCLLPDLDLATIPPYDCNQKCNCLQSLKTSKELIFYRLLRSSDHSAKGYFHGNENPK